MNEDRSGERRADVTRLPAKMIAGNAYNQVIRAFSSEVDTGSREENASKQKTGARF
jgi:hypothetical protein